MSHIVEFAIGGLAGRADVYKQKLNRHLNIFFGLNGSGKTSLLKILQSAMSNDASMLRMVPFEWAEVTIHSLQYKKDYVYSIASTNLRRKTPSIDHDLHRTDTADFRFIGQQAWNVQDRSMPDTLKWQIKPKPPRGSRGSWKHIFLPTWRMYSEETPLGPIAGLNITDRREVDWDFLFARRLEEMWSRYTNELLAEIKKIQGEALANILLKVLTPSLQRKGLKKIEATVAYQRVRAFLTRQESSVDLGSADEFAKRYLKDARLRTVVNDINSVEQKIEKATTARDKLEVLIRDLFIGNKKVSFRDTGIEVETSKGQTLGLVSLSSGEKHILSIFVDSLLAEQSTLMIDEPEISLHVDWQKKLVLSMQQLNPDPQFVLATHSPEIMADIDDRFIFSL